MITFVPAISKSELMNNTNLPIFRLQILILSKKKKMQKLLLITTLLFIISASSFAQVELVADINEGDGDSGVYCDFTFTDNQNCVVTLGDKFIFSAENETIGRELYVLENGVVNLIVDLNNDPSDSDPQYLTVFQEAAYFVADDNTGYKIWRTDGTAAGTEIAFDLGVDDASRSDYHVFLINGDKLYFEFDGTIYSYDGMDLASTEYEDNIFVVSSSGFNSSGWCSYKEGIAVMDYNGTSWDLLYIHDGTVDNLMNFTADASFKNPYAMAAFEGGISFSFEASFDEDIEGRYVYLDGSNTSTKQSDEFTVRNISVNDKSCILYTNGEFILYDENNILGAQVITGQMNLVQGGDWNRILIGDHLAFQSSGGVFEDDRISLFNSLDGSLKEVYVGDDLTRLYNYGQHIFFFAESQNSIFDEALYRYDMDTEELEQIQELIDLPNNSDLYPIGADGSYLYFYGNLEDGVGTEIYRLPVDINTTTKNTKLESNLSFVQTGLNTFIVETEIKGDFNVEVYSMDGQFLKKQIMSNGQSLDIRYSGLIMIHAEIESSRETYKKVVLQ